MGSGHPCFLEREKLQVFQDFLPYILRSLCKKTSLSFLSSHKYSLGICHLPSTINMEDTMINKTDTSWAVREPTPQDRTMAQRELRTPQPSTPNPLNRPTVSDVGGKRGRSLQLHRKKEVILLESIIFFFQEKYFKMMKGGYQLLDLAFKAGD